MPRPTNESLFDQIRQLHEKLTDVSSRCSMAEARAEEAHARLNVAATYVLRLRLQLHDTLALHAEQLEERLSIAIANG